MSENIDKIEQMFVDATPNEDYPIRILQAYRQRCFEKWATSIDGSCDNPVYQLMNEDQDKRLLILDKAIEILMTAKFKKGTL